MNCLENIKVKPFENLRIRNAPRGAFIWWLYFS